jgi:ATP-dependent Clp protease ATP-binding subunit ClpA
MSEYMENLQSRLVGAPPGYVGMKVVNYRKVERENHIVLYY